MDIKHPPFWFGMGMLIVDTVKKTMSDDCDQKLTSKGVGMRFWGHWDLDISPGKNHISPKEQERISFEKISFAEIFFCFKGVEMVVTKK